MTIDDICERHARHTEFIAASPSPGLRWRESHEDRGHLLQVVIRLRKALFVAANALDQAAEDLAMCAETGNTADPCLVADRADEAATAAQKAHSVLEAL